MDGASRIHLDTLMDHDPDCLPARQLPLTATCIALSKRSAKVALALRSVLALQVPEYSVLPPDTAARHVPLHPSGDFAADHPPRATVAPLAPTSVHVPVAAPAGSETTVQVPAKVSPVLLRALHVFGEVPGRDPVCAATATETGTHRAAASITTPGRRVRLALTLMPSVPASIRDEL